MEEIKLSTGIKKIAIKDEDGEVVTVLSVNVADARTADKFARIGRSVETGSCGCGCYRRKSDSIDFGSK